MFQASLCLSSGEQTVQNRVWC